MTHFECMRVPACTVSSLHILYVMFCFVWWWYYYTLAEIGWKNSFVEAVGIIAAASGAGATREALSF